ncbi:MAG: hypothetical protein ACOYT8_01800 [Candidatus Dependentiae bacterium]
MIFLFIIILLSNTVWAEDIKSIFHPSALNEKISAKPNGKQKKNRKRKISFYFDNEDLVDIINLMSAEKRINVVLPKEPINQKVTLHIEEKLTLSEAWDIFQTLLNIAGYNIVPHAGNYQIIKTTPDLIRESLPLYVGVLPPDTDQPVRYLHYLSNIRASDAADSELLAILKNVLSDSALFKADIKVDVATNSFLITDRGSNIRAAIQILNALDQTTYKETLEVLRLHFVQASFVVDQILKELQVTVEPNKLPGSKKPEGTYFQPVAVAAVPRTNSIILRGRAQAVERLKDFIMKYIDVEIGTGKSILHVYQLQYLDADSFVPVLESIIKGQRGGGPEQARGGEATEGGPERLLQSVIVKSDKTLNLGNKEAAEGKFAGNNNLIIAARSDDWEYIKKFIEQVDRPQDIVMLQVLIADLTLNDVRLLGSSIRNPAQLPFPHLVNFQSAQTTPNILLNENTVPPANTLQSDLLRNAYPPTTPGGDNRSAASFFSPGSMAVAFNDPNSGQTWGILQIQKLLDNTKVLSHPHVIAINNKQAMITVTEDRFLQDAAAGSSGGAINATRKWIPAQLTVGITPRISSANTVNLHIEVDIVQFTSANVSDGNRLARKVITNANVANGCVLALGGLTRIDMLDALNETPLLGQIPILGWFFKRRSSAATKTFLTVFISPTIIKPRLRAGISEMTKDYVEIAQNYSNENYIFDNLRDPITRWFFQPTREPSQALVDQYLATDPEIAADAYEKDLLDEAGIEESFHIASQQSPAQLDDNKDKQLKDLVNQIEENPFSRT